MANNVFSLGRLRKVFWIAWPILMAIGLIFTGVYALNSLGFEGQFVNEISPTSAIALVKGMQLGQTFVAPRAGLERIDVLLYGYWRRNSQPVTFHLREVGAEEDKVTITAGSGEVRGWQWKTFRFDPLADSKGRTYYFFLESSASTPEDALTVGGVEGDLYPNGTAIINGQPAFADAAFMTSYAGVSFREKLSALAHKMTGAKPSLWGDVRFYILIGCLYLLLVIGLVRWLAVVPGSCTGAGLRALTAVVPSSGSPLSFPPHVCVPMGKGGHAYAYSVQADSVQTDRRAQGGYAEEEAPTLPSKLPPKLQGTAADKHFNWR